MKYVLITLALVGGGMLYFLLWDQVICLHQEENVICEIISYL
jgi:hypothetical protein